jgi:hypothetical protein
MQEARNRYYSTHLEEMKVGEGEGEGEGSQILFPGEDVTSSVRELVEKHIDGVPPFPKEEMRAHYERYMVEANLTRELFESREVKTAWANMLKQLSNAVDFSIGMWSSDSFACREKDSRRGKAWMTLDCSIYGHQHGREDTGNICTHEKCLLLQEPVGDVLLSAVLSGLSLASSNVKELEIKCVNSGACTWVDDGSLDGLDLSKLQRLSFEPRIVGVSNHPLLRGSGDRLEERLGVGITAILRKCAQSLQTLDLMGNAGVWTLFPENHYAVVSLPSLKRFTTSAEIHCSSFAFFLCQARNLEHVELKGCRGRGEGEWREIFQAIRHHRCRMLVVFDQLYFPGVYGIPDRVITIHHDTRENTPRESVLPRVDRGFDYSMKMYMSNRVQWNRTLEDFFQYWDLEEGDEWQSGDEETDEEQEVYWQGGNDGWCTAAYTKQMARDRRAYVVATMKELVEAIDLRHKDDDQMSSLKQKIRYVQDKIWDLEEVELRDLEGWIRTMKEALERWHGE